MKAEEFLSMLLFVSLGLFLIRWLINWSLINKMNGTTFSIFRANYSLKDFFGLFKHVAISEWKIWWFDLENNKTMKIISNTLSATFYLMIIGIILTFIYTYKI